jgi:proteasome lid subunit RPN8/RPN11
VGWFGRNKTRRLAVREGYEKLPEEEWTEDEVDHHLQTCSEDEYWAYWDRWSLDTYEHPTVRKIRKSALDMGFEAARASFPQEFGCMLRVEKDTITELVLVPGTIQGDEHAIFALGNLPVDRSIQGTLHSHPDPHPYPSDADFELFEHHGTIHLILAQPYEGEAWRAYDHTGVPTYLDVVD